VVVANLLQSIQERGPSQLLPAEPAGARLR
jgi:hypothetical protein